MICSSLSGYVAAAWAGTMTSADAEKGLVMKAIVPVLILLVIPLGSAAAQERPSDRRRLPAKVDLVIRDGHIVVDEGVAVTPAAAPEPADATRALRSA